MLGIGNIFTIANGACAELCDAQGAEVIDVCGRTPVALTVANGLKLLESGLPAELNSVARSMTIKHLAQGAQHGLAVTSLGALYVWGDCSYGQLGLRQSTLEGGFAPQPVLHAHLERQTIARVAAGDHHSVAVTGACCTASDDSEAAFICSVPEGCAAFGRTVSLSVARAPLHLFVQRILACTRGAATARGSAARGPAPRSSCPVLGLERTAS